MADPEAEAARDLIQRHFGPCEEMDRRYVGDITYIATWEGWAYLATVIDLASRKVVGWALADHMRTELVNDALTMAFANRAPQRRCHFSFATGAVNIRAVTSPSWPGPTASCSRSGARASAGTTRWPNLLRHHQARAHRHPRLADESRTSTRRLRVHRGLVQHAPAALDARLPQPRPIRSCPPQRRPSGGMINTSNLSVEPDQAHMAFRVCSGCFTPELGIWSPFNFSTHSSRSTLHSDQELEVVEAVRNSLKSSPECS